jgi:small basic protein (TIGR04137 family)
MSRHPSYGNPSKGGKKRNVLKRFERIAILRKAGKWKETENKVTALPKTLSVIA